VSWFGKSDGEEFEGRDVHKRETRLLVQEGEWCLRGWWGGIGDTRS